MKKADKKAALIAWVNSSPENLKTFEEGWGAGNRTRTVEDYLEEYSYIPDIIDRLASDLEITHLFKKNGAK